MRIIDENNVEITSPDLSLGCLVEEEIFIAHHDAVEAVAEQWHYETIAEYPNGGKDVARVVDVPGVEAQEAWDEYETIQRYIRYTDEELAEQKKPDSDPSPSLEERLATVESDVANLTTAIQKGLSL